MNKADLVALVAKEAELTKAVATQAVDTVVEGIKKALFSGDRVQLIGLGSFSVKNRPARTGRNPKTGAAMKIAAKNVAKFSPAKELKDIKVKAKKK